MYIIKLSDGRTLHNPNLVESGKVVVDPVLTEQLNTHGSLSFTIAPSNPLYSEITPRTTKLRVISNVDNGTDDWFGRVISVERTIDNCKRVYCEGEMAFLLDAICQPFGFKGSPETLLSNLLTEYRNANTAGYALQVGNVSVEDPNDYIVRSEKNAKTVWDAIKGNLFESSLGGYLLPRYDKENDVHYIDYLRLTTDDPYAHNSSQVVKFGANLLGFVEKKSAENIVTAVIPYGAEFASDDSRFEDGAPDNGAWNGNRLTVESVNSGSKIVRNTTGEAIWGTVYGTKTWGDVTVAANLLRKAQAWLADQVEQSISLEVSAIDLAFVKADIEQIRLGSFTRVQSIPHNLDMIMLCTKKTTHLADLAKSTVTLGAPQSSISSDVASEKPKSTTTNNGYTPLANAKIIVTHNDSSTLTGSGCQSAFVTEAGKLYVIRTNSTYCVYDLSITSGSKMVNGTKSAGVALDHNIGHGNSACYNNGLAYISHWTADDGNGNQTTDGGIIHVFSVDSANNTMSYVRDITLPIQVGRRTEHYVYPGEGQILSCGWEYRSSANSKYMIMTMWKKGSDGVYVKAWERNINGITVAQALSVYNDKAYIVNNNYNNSAYTHIGLMVVDLATGLQKLDTSQTGTITTVETEQLIPLGGGQFIIVSNRGHFFYATEA